MKSLLKPHIFHGDQKHLRTAVRRLCFLPYMGIFLLLTSCPTSPPAELPTKLYKMESATYYKIGGVYGSWIDVDLTYDSPPARAIFADQEGMQPISYLSVLSVPGKELISASGAGSYVELDPSATLDSIADQGIIVQADTTKWFYIKSYTGFLGALEVSAKCRFDTLSVPIVFAGQQ